MLGRRDAGDTLIEVLFAVSIFSAVAIGTILIMNQGISSAQNALEINLVRNQIDTQAELLRHLNGAKLTSIGRDGTDASAEWDKAVGATSGTTGNAAYAPSPQAESYDKITTYEECTPDSLPANAFYINPKTGEVQRNIVSAVTFAQVQTGDGAPVESNMLWIEPVSSQYDASDTTLRLTTYYDFHIRACWDASGARGGVMKLGTIVRLYVPKQ